PTVLLLGSHVRGRAKLYLVRASRCSSGRPMVLLSGSHLRGRAKLYLVRASPCSSGRPTVLLSGSHIRGRAKPFGRGALAFRRSVFLATRAAATSSTSFSSERC